MSVKVMAQVWELDLPSTEKLIALAFADHANDAGICCPSMARVAWKSGVSRDTVKRCCAAFRETGLFRELRTGTGRGNATLYQICPQKGCTLPPFVADAKPEKGGTDLLKGGNDALKGGTAMPPESYNRNLEPKERTGAASRPVLPPPCGNLENRTPSQNRYAETAKLATEAQKILGSKPPGSYADLKEKVKCLAAAKGMAYDGDMVGNAIDIAERRLRESA